MPSIHMSRADRHRRMYRSYKARLRVKEAADENQVSEKTAWRYFRLFDLVRDKLGDLKIQAELQYWSLDYVREVVSALPTEIEAPTPQPPPPSSSPLPPSPTRPAHPVASVDPKYLGNHGRNLLALAGRIRSTLKRGVPMSVRPIATGRWSDPFLGKVTDVPRLLFEDEPLIGSLVAHLSETDFELNLAALRQTGGRQRDAVDSLMKQTFRNESQRLLPEDMRIAIVDYGLQKLILPSTEEPVIALREHAGNHALFVGAHRSSYGAASEASAARQHAEDALMRVPASVPGAKVVEELHALKSLLIELSVFLSDTDLVERTISQSSCDRCGSVEG